MDPSSVTVGRSAQAVVNLVIARGADFECVMRYSAGDPPVQLDLTAWTARAQLRDNPGGPVWETLSNGAGLTLASDGTITLAIPHGTTEDPTWDSRRSGVWDLELTDPSGRRVRLVEGSVRVSQDVTRDG